MENSMKGSVHFASFFFFCAWMGVFQPQPLLKWNRLERID